MVIIAASPGACRPRLSACRRAAGLDRWEDRRRDRLSSEAAHREPVRLAGQGQRRAIVREGRVCGQGMEPQRAPLRRDLGHSAGRAAAVPQAVRAAFQLIQFADCPVDMGEGDPELLGDHMIRKALAVRLLLDLLRDLQVALFHHVADRR